MLKMAKKERLEDLSKGLISGKLDITNLKGEIVGVKCIYHNNSLRFEIVDKLTREAPEEANAYLLGDEENLSFLTNSESDACYAVVYLKIPQ